MVDCGEQSLTMALYPFNFADKRLAIWTNSVEPSEGLAFFFGLHTQDWNAGCVVTGCVSDVLIGDFFGPHWHHLSSPASKQQSWLEGEKIAQTPSS